MGGSQSTPLPVVESVDVDKYMGTWYEYAKYPNRFQSADGQNVTATYTKNNDGTVKVVNAEDVNGERKSVQGKAWVANASETLAKLKVSFFWPFAGDYWIIQLGDNYEYAVVGEPGRKFLWVLSRTPQMAEETYQGICTKLVEQDYDPEKVKKTPQAEPTAA